MISNLISKSTNNVIDSVFEAALYAAREGLSEKKDKYNVASNRQRIERDHQMSESAKRKRQILNQNGGSILGLLIPTLLVAVFSTLGPKLFA